MQTVGLHQLSLARYRQGGVVPKDSPELRRQISKHGFLDPIVVRPGKTPGEYEILSNAETYVAAGKLGLHEVPIVVREDLADEAAVDALRDRYQHPVGNPVDEARWFKELLAEEADRPRRAKQGIATVARRTGKSRTYVSRSLALLRLPDEVQEHIRAGRLSAGHARCLIPMRSRDDQIRFAARAVRQGLSVRALEALVKDVPRSSREAGRAVMEGQRDADVAQLERELSDLLGAPCKIQASEGIVTIDYCKDLELLEGILQRLGYEAG